MDFLRSQAVTIHPWSLTLLAAGLIIAIFIEQRTTRIPNYVTVTMGLGGIVLALVDGAWGLHLAGFLAGFAVGVTAWILGMARAGAVKLLAAVGAVTNPLFVAMVILMIVPLGVACWLVLRRASRDPKIPAESQQPFLLRGSWMIAGSCVLAAGIFGILRHYG